MMTDTHIAEGDKVKTLHGIGRVIRVERIISACIFLIAYDSFVPNSYESSKGDFRLWLFSDEVEHALDS